LKYLEVLHKIDATDRKLLDLRAKLASDQKKGLHKLPADLPKISEFTNLKIAFEDARITEPDQPLYRRLKKGQQRINQTTNKRKRLMSEARKIDTRSKIQLGGLVVKAGLRETDKAVILGALMELATDIETGNSKKIESLKKRGAAELAAS